MWKKILALVLSLIVVVGIIVGVYFIFFHESQPRGEDIEEGKKYYIRELRPGTYRYPTATSSSTFIGLQDATPNTSYCVFEDNFKTFKVYFRSGTTAEFDFVVTKIKHGNGKLSATVRHIYAGYILTYKVYTTQTRIILETSVTRTILVATEEYTQPQLQTFTRDTQVMAFARTTPDDLVGYVP